MTTIQKNNKHYIECNVIMLPTDKSTTIHIADGELVTGKLCQNTIHYQYQELYILSNEEIKENDWFINLYSNSIFQYVSGYGKKQGNKYEHFALDLSTCKKICATTDSSLIKEFINREDCVNNPCPIYTPQVSQQFIRHFITEYNKGNVTNKVLVEVILNETGNYREFDSTPNLLYKIKLNQNNEISILTEQKENYSRKEVIEILKKFDIEMGDTHGPTTRNKWIEQNLK